MIFAQVSACFINKVVTISNYIHQRELDKKLLIVEVIYITALTYTFVLAFKVFLLLFAIFLVIVFIVAIVEIPFDYKKIKRNKDFDSKYNSD